MNKKYSEQGAYLSRSPYSLWRQRIPWLLFLMISATVSGVILTGFESALPSVLLIFVPMLMDSGGNCGAQASVTVIRALTLGQAGFSELPKIIRKEAAVGFLCGMSLGAVAFFKVILIDGLIMKNQGVNISVAVCVALSIAITAVAAKLIGALLPIFAKRIGIDPAVMVSPFITTLVDAVALILYFFISVSILPPRAA